MKNNNYCIFYWYQSNLAQPVTPQTVSSLHTVTTNDRLTICIQFVGTLPCKTPYPLSHD